MTTRTTIQGHHSPWFGTTVVRALATAVIVVVALLFALQSPVHAQEPDQAGTVALSTTTPQVGVAITASLTDPDGGITGTTWLWSSSDTSGGTYTNISGATSASYTPMAADSGKYLKATASYTDMHGSGKSAEKVADNAVDTLGSVAIPRRPELGIPLTANLTDADGSVSGTTWQWSSSDAVDGTFTAISGGHVGDVLVGGGGSDEVPAGHGLLHGRPRAGQDRHGDRDQRGARG